MRGRVTVSYYNRFILNSNGANDGVIVEMMLQG